MFRLPLALTALPTMLLLASCARNDAPAVSVMAAPASPGAATAAPAAAPAHPALPMAHTETTADDPVLATVNDKTITMWDVRTALRLKSEEDEVTPEQLDLVLDMLIRQELIAQEASRVGLDRDPGYVAALAKVEAPVLAFRRRALGDAYFKQIVAAQVTVSDAEVTAYYDANKALFESEFRIAQYLTKDEARAKAASAALQRGKSFDDVARAEFAGLPVDQKPWELGWSPWQLLPVPWQQALMHMKVGENSAILQGEGHRFWIIRLLEKRPAKDASQQKIKADILTHLRDRAVEAKRNGMGDDLVAKAKIVRRKAAAPAENSAVP